MIFLYKIISKLTYYLTKIYIKSHLNIKQNAAINIPRLIKEVIIDCSLILVDEVINSEPVYPMGWDSVIKYWKEVRQELINLKQGYDGRQIK